MQYCRYTPPAPLRQFVECLWYWEGVPKTHSKERLLPDGESSIIFNLAEERIRIYDAHDLTRFQNYSCALFSGARSSCFAIDTNEEERVVGVEFRPGGAFPFFQVPASETEDRSVDLDDLWPSRAGAIRERLLSSPHPEAMLCCLEQCLLEQLVRPLELHPAIDYALNQFSSSAHTARVGGVMEQIGLSSRRFIELFRRQVGLPPKTFCRVRRFQNVLRTIHQKRDLDWASTALDCGYYDQAHFIHDFQSFSGLTPAAYAAVATPHLNHVPLTT